MRRAALGALAVIAVLVLAPVAAAACPRTSLPAIESQVMCPTCGIPLAEANSPQADREREFIRALVAQCATTAQVKQALIAEFGPSVLALPKGSGFNLVVYIVPAAAVLLVAAGLALALPRWRRRGRAPDPGVAAAPVSAEDAARLDEDLARYR